MSRNNLISSEFRKSLAEQDALLDEIQQLKNMVKMQPSQQKSGPNLTFLRESERAHWNTLLDSNIRAGTMACMWCMKTQCVKMLSIAFNKWKLFNAVTAAVVQATGSQPTSPRHDSPRFGNAVPLANAVGERKPPTEPPLKEKPRKAAGNFQSYGTPPTAAPAQTALEFDENGMAIPIPSKGPRRLLGQGSLGGGPAAAFGGSGNGNNHTNLSDLSPALKSAMAVVNKFKSLKEQQSQNGTLYDSDVTSQTGQSIADPRSKPTAPVVGVGNRSRAGTGTGTDDSSVEDVDMTVPLTPAAMSYNKLAATMSMDSINSQNLLQYVTATNLNSEEHLGKDGTGGEQLPNRSLRNTQPASVGYSNPSTWNGEPSGAHGSAGAGAGAGAGEGVYSREGRLDDSELAEDDPLAMERMLVRSEANSDTKRKILLTLSYDIMGRSGMSLPHSPEHGNASASPPSSPSHPSHPFKGSQGFPQQQPQQQGPRPSSRNSNSGNSVSSRASRASKGTHTSSNNNNNNSRARSPRSIKKLTSLDLLGSGASAGAGAAGQLSGSHSSSRSPSHHSMTGTGSRARGNKEGFDPVADALERVQEQRESKPSYMLDTISHALSVSLGSADGGGARGVGGELGFINGLRNEHPHHHPQNAQQGSAGSPTATSPRRFMTINGPPGSAPGGGPGALGGEESVAGCSTARSRSSSARGRGGRDVSQDSRGGHASYDPSHNPEAQQRQGRDRAVAKGAAERGVAGAGGERPFRSPGPGRGMMGTGAGGGRVPSYLVPTFSSLKKHAGAPEDGPLLSAASAAAALSFQQNPGSVHKRPVNAAQLPPHGAHSRNQSPNRHQFIPRDRRNHFKTAAGSAGGNPGADASDQLHYADIYDANISHDIHDLQNMYPEETVWDSGGDGSAYFLSAPPVSDASIGPSNNSRYSDMHPTPPPPPLPFDAGPGRTGSSAGGPVGSSSAPLNRRSTMNPLFRQRSSNNTINNNNESENYSPGDLSNTADPLSQQQRQQQQQNQRQQQWNNPSTGQYSQPSSYLSTNCPHRSSHNYDPYSQPPPPTPYQQSPQGPLCADKRMFAAPADDHMGFRGEQSMAAQAHREDAGDAQRVELLNSLLAAHNIDLDSALGGGDAASSMLADPLDNSQSPVINPVSGGLPPTLPDPMLQPLNDVVTDDEETNLNNYINKYAALLQQAKSQPPPSALAANANLDNTADAYAPAVSLVTQQPAEDRNSYSQELKSNSDVPSHTYAPSPGGYLPGGPPSLQQPLDYSGSQVRAQMHATGAGAARGFESEPFYPSQQPPSLSYPPPQPPYQQQQQPQQQQYYAQQAAGREWDGKMDFGRKDNQQQRGYFDSAAGDPSDYDYGAQNPYFPHHQSRSDPHLPHLQHSAAAQPYYAATSQSYEELQQRPFEGYSSQFRSSAQPAVGQDRHLGLIDDRDRYPDPLQGVAAGRGGEDFSRGEQSRSALNASHGSMGSSMRAQHQPKNNNNSQNSNSNKKKMEKAQLALLTGQDHSKQFSNRRAWERTLRR